MAAVTQARNGGSGQGPGGRKAAAQRESRPAGPDESGVGPLPGLSPPLDWPPRRSPSPWSWRCPAGTAGATGSGAHAKTVKISTAKVAGVGTVLTTVGPDAVPLHRGLAGHVDLHRRLRQNLAAASGRQGCARVGTPRCEGPLAPEGRQRPLAGRLPQAPALPLRRRQEEGAGARAERGQGLVRRVEERPPGHRGSRRLAATSTTAPRRRRRRPATSTTRGVSATQRPRVATDAGHAAATARRRRRRRPRRRLPAAADDTERRASRPSPAGCCSDGRRASAGRSGARRGVRWRRCRPSAR